MVQQLQPTTVDSDWLYPESDGLPLSDNTIQFRLITTIQGGIDALFADDPNIFVAGDLLWYPIEAVEGVAKSQAPDVMVVFGRPKGDRRSYKQFLEDNIAPQVVFEILSHSNTKAEMLSKFNFYERYGVEEYYLYDPATNLLKGWLKRDNKLISIDKMEGWLSPRLGCRFETAKGSLELYRPDGQRMETFVENSKRAEQESQRAEQESQRAEQESQRAEQEAQRAEQEAQRAEQEAQRAEQEAQRAEQESQRAEQESQRAEQESQRAEQESQRAEQESQRAEQESQRAEQESQRAEQEAQRAEQETKARRDAIPRLLALGLSVEQVAQALNLSVEEVNQSR
ncbi:MAG: Uma2 family endonuclease [Symploca sp. SIO2G7]|nr:Uma2 family endonuclease [Symploca sp. SIO2G7]